MYAEYYFLLPGISENYLRKPITKKSLSVYKKDAHKKDGFTDNSATYT